MRRGRARSPSESMSSRFLLSLELAQQAFLEGLRHTIGRPSRTYDVRDLGVEREVQLDRVAVRDGRIRAAQVELDVQLAIDIAVHARLELLVVEVGERGDGEAEVVRARRGVLGDRLR